MEKVIINRYNKKHINDLIYWSKLADNLNNNLKHFTPEQKAVINNFFNAKDDMNLYYYIKNISDDNVIHKIFNIQ